MFKMPKKRTSQYWAEHLEVRSSEIHGLGIFATEKIGAHEIIEVAPVILFHANTFKTLYEIHGSYHILNSYVFKAAHGGLVGMGLGYSSIYNHGGSSGANVTWRWHKEIEALEFITRREIQKDEELLINYDGVKGDMLVFSMYGDHGSYATQTTE